MLSSPYSMEAIFGRYIVIGSRTGSVTVVQLSRQTSSIFEFDRDKKPRDPLSLPLSEPSSPLNLKRNSRPYSVPGLRLTLIPVKRGCEPPLPSQISSSFVSSASVSLGLGAIPSIVSDVRAASHTRIASPSPASQEAFAVFAIAWMDGRICICHILPVSSHSSDGNTAHRDREEKLCWAVVHCFHTKHSFFRIGFYLSSAQNWPALDDEQVQREEGSPRDQQPEVSHRVSDSNRGRDRHTKSLRTSASGLITAIPEGRALPTDTSRQEKGESRASLRLPKSRETSVEGGPSKSLAGITADGASSSFRSTSSLVDRQDNNDLDYYWKSVHGEDSENGDATIPPVESKVASTIPQRVFSTASLVSVDSTDNVDNLWRSVHGETHEEEGREEGKGRGADATLELTATQEAPQSTFHPFLVAIAHSGHTIFLSLLQSEMGMSAGPSTEKRRVFSFNSRHAVDAALIIDFSLGNFSSKCLFASLLYIHIHMICLQMHLPSLRLLDEPLYQGRIPTNPSTEFPPA